MKKIQKTLVVLRAAIAGVLLVGATAGQAQVTRTLYTTNGTPLRNNYSGVVGGSFLVGSTNVVVSHLGYFDDDGDGNNISHFVGLFTSNRFNPLVLLGDVTVPAGTSAYYTNGFRWVQLNPPLLLLANTTYNLGGQATNLDGDVWRDNYVPVWNPAFVGTNGSATRRSIFSPNNNLAWPPPSFGLNLVDGIYGNVSMGYIEIDPAKVGMATTNIAAGAGSNIPLVGFGTGEQPIAYQWFTSGGSPLANQTNSTLVISNASVGVSGFYLTATNALGGAQSATVTVTVTAVPVGISLQPTNLNLFANYTASFFTSATGTPPISYQWSRNGSPIPGANSTSYSFTASTTNNGDVYSCLASNFIAGTPYTSVSSNATLTVNYNLASPQQLLHGAPTGSTLNRSNFAGMLGGRITVGAAPVTVTHLAYFAPIDQYVNASNAYLTVSHRVGIFGAGGVMLLGSATVPAGTNSVISGYIWVPLTPPLVLSSNTQYTLAAEVFLNDDPYPDSRLVPDLNPYFATACAATFWGAPWPGGGVSGLFAGQMYGPPNMAILAAPTPTSDATPTNITEYVGFSASFSALISGQAPMSVQWYKQPGTLLTGKTNLTLSFNSLTLGDSGNYYVVATNTVTSASATSPDVVLNVIPTTGPTITQDIVSQSAFFHQTVRFVGAGGGTPPLSYQWKFNGNPIAGATNATLVLPDVSSASVGNYQLTVSNPYAPFTTNSSSAALTVEYPAWGTYTSAIIGTNLLLYYPLDITGGFATNYGSLGYAYNGTNETGTSGSGPTGPNFPPGNLAFVGDGFSTDVAIPQLGVTVSNVTIAAWIYQANGQLPNTTIFFQRGGGVFGLSVADDPTNSSTQLRFTWNATGFANESHLNPPTNQWAFVAMVVNPTNVALYLHDGVSMKSTNFPGTYPAQTFTANSYIGWDTAGTLTGRRWTGSIDEVTVFNEALSPQAINALYLGVPATATIQIAPLPGDKQMLTWPGGALQETTNLVSGPWTTVSGATSPYTNSAPPSSKFFRVKLQ